MSFNAQVKPKMMQDTLSNHSVDVTGKPRSTNVTGMAKNSITDKVDTRTLQEHVISATGQNFLPPLKAGKEKRKPKKPKFELPQTTLSRDAQ